jgi:hypothetical protein
MGGMGGWIGNLLEELAHKVMKAEKFHDAASDSWRTRKAGSVTQSKCKSLRQRSQWCDS